MDYYDLPAAKTFLVSQKALILDDARVLLLKQAYAGQRWELPGGLLEMNEDLAAGLKREVREETGLEIANASPLATAEIIVPDFIFKNGSILDARIIHVIYLCTTASGSIRLSDEHTAFVWVNKNEMNGMDLAPECLPALNAYLNR